MKYIRISLFFALVMCLVLSISSPAIAAEEGSCGLDATWRFEDGTLTISGKGLVTDICWYEFHNRILKVVVEPGIINLPNNAFQDCEFLTEVILPDGFTLIGSFAFHNCNSLGTVQLPATLGHIGQHAFSNSGITGITIPGSVERIGTSAFDNCEKLLRVTVEEGVTYIGASAFHGCKKLAEITLPDSLKIIENKAFESCSSLQSIVLPQHVTVISAQAFQGCNSLASVTLSPKTTTIEYNAFAQCYALRSISLPPTVQTIQGLSSALEEIHISDLTAWCTAEHSYKNHCLQNAGLYLNGELLTDLRIPDDCNAISAHASCTAIAMSPTLFACGHVIMHNCLNIINIQSTRAKIGRYKNWSCPIIQQVNRLFSIKLFKSSMIHTNRQSRLAHHIINSFHTLTVINKKDNFTIIQRAHQVNCNINFIPHRALHLNNRHAFTWIIIRLRKIYNFRFAER